MASSNKSPRLKVANNSNSTMTRSGESISGHMDPEKQDTSGDEKGAVLGESRKLALHMLVIVGVTIYCDTNIDSIWSLYALEEFGASESDIGWIFFAYYLMSGAGLFVLAYVGEYMTFANVQTFNFLISAPALLLQGLATNIPMLIVGRLIAAFFTPDSSLFLGYISQYLPVTSQNVYDSYLNATVMLIFVLGSITSGIVATISSFRMNFYVVSIIALLGFAYGMFFLFNKQKYILTLQNTYYEKNKNNVTSSDQSQFPLINKLIASTTDIDTTTKEEDSGSDKVEMFQKVMISFHVLHSFFFWGAIHIISSFYTLYMFEKFDTDVLISTLQLALDGIFIIVGSLFTPKLLKKVRQYTDYTKLNDTKNIFAEYLILIIAIILLIVLSAGIPFLTNDDIYWVLLPIAGIVFGVVAVIELIILQSMQPHKHSGKIGGIYMASQQVGAAVSALLVGLFWYYDIEWIWYWFLIWNFLALLCVFVILFINKSKMGKIIRIEE